MPYHLQNGGILDHFICGSQTPNHPSMHAYNVQPSLLFKYVYYNICLATHVYMDEGEYYFKKMRVKLAQSSGRVK